MSVMMKPGLINLEEISSGMTTTVEVKVGRRRIIEFFLPAVDYIKESFELR